MKHLVNAGLAMTMFYLAVILKLVADKWMGGFLDGTHFRSS